MSGLSSSTTQPSLSFTPASLMSALQEPVPGSAQFSSPSPCPVTPVSPVSTFQLPVPHFYIYYITVSIRCDPCFTGVASSSACSWVCPVFFSFTMSCYPCVTMQCRLFNDLCLYRSAPFSSITSQPQFGVTPVSLVSALQMPIPGSGHLLLLHHRLHFLCQLFQCLALIFHLHLLFLHQLYCLLSIHFLNVIPLFQSPAAIFLYLI